MLALNNAFICDTTHQLCANPRSIRLVPFNHSHLREALNQIDQNPVCLVPLSFGFITFCHLTRQWSPLAFYDPFHKKALLILSIFFIAHFFIAKTTKKWTGMNDITELTEINLPTLSINLDFQLESFGETLLITGWILVLLSGQAQILAWELHDQTL